MSATVLHKNWRFNGELKQVKISMSLKKKQSLGFLRKDGRSDYPRTNVSSWNSQFRAITAIICNQLPLLLWAQVDSVLGGNYFWAFLIS